MYNMSKEDRQELGRLGREHLSKNYNAEILLPKWDEIFQRLHKDLGSWDTRKHQSWTIKSL